MLEYDISIRIAIEPKPDTDFYTALNSKGNLRLAFPCVVVCLLLNLIL